MVRISLPGSGRFRVGEIQDSRDIMAEPTFGEQIRDFADNLRHAGQDGSPWKSQVEALRVLYTALETRLEFDRDQRLFDAMTISDGTASSFGIRVARFRSSDVVVYAVLTDCLPGLFGGTQALSGGNTKRFRLRHRSPSRTRHRVSDSVQISPLLPCCHSAGRAAIACLSAVNFIRDVLRVTCRRRRKATIKIAVRISTMVGAGALSMKKLA